MTRWMAIVAGLGVAGAAACSGSDPNPTAVVVPSRTASAESPRPEDDVLIGYVDHERGKVCLEPVRRASRAARCADLAKASHVIVVDGDTLLATFQDGKLAKVDLKQDTTSWIDVWGERTDTEFRFNQHRVVRRPLGIFARACSSSWTMEEGVAECSKDALCVAVPGFVAPTAPPQCTGEDPPDWDIPAPEGWDFDVVPDAPLDDGEIHGASILCSRSPGDPGRVLMDRTHGNPMSSSVTAFGVPGAPGHVLLHVIDTMSIAAGTDEANAYHEGALYFLTGCDQAELLATTVAPYPGELLVRGPLRTWSSWSRDGWTVWDGGRPLKRVPGEPAFWQRPKAALAE